jgi:hypothetical protein
MASKRVNIDDVIRSERDRVRSAALRAENSELQTALQKTSSAAKRAAKGAYTAGMSGGVTVAVLAGFGVTALEWILTRFLPPAYATWGKWICLVVSSLMIAGGYFLSMPVLLWGGIVSGLLVMTIWLMGKYGIIPANLAIQGAEQEMDGDGIDDLDLTEIGAAIADDSQQTEPEQSDVEQFLNSVDEWVSSGASTAGLVALTAKGVALFGPEVIKVLKGLKAKIGKGGRYRGNRKASDVVRASYEVRRVQHARKERPDRVQHALPAPVIPAGQPLRAEDIQRMVNAAVAEREKQWSAEIAKLKAADGSTTSIEGPGYYPQIKAMMSDSDHVNAVIAGALAR